MKRIVAVAVGALLVAAACTSDASVESAGSQAIQQAVPADNVVAAGGDGDVVAGDQAEVAENGETLAVTAADTTGTTEVESADEAATADPAAPGTDTVAAPAADGGAGAASPAAEGTATTKPALQVNVDPTTTAAPTGDGNTGGDSTTTSVSSNGSDSSTTTSRTATSTTSRATSSTQRTTTPQQTTTTQLATTTTTQRTTTTQARPTTAPPRAGSVRPATGAGDYLETFDSRSSMNSIDFYVVNARAHNSRPTAWPGDHSSGGDCGNPFTTRTVSWPDPAGDVVATRFTDAGEAAYWCAPAGAGSGHMMTAFHTAGYAHLDFSPKQKFNDVRWVCYDANPTNLGNRKWNQVAVVSTSVSNPVAPRLDWTIPRFQEGGPGAFGLPITDGVFMFTTTLGGAKVQTGGGPEARGNKTDKSVSDPKKRVTTCLHDLRNGQVEVIQERWNGSVDVTTLPGAFPRGEVRVVWQDVSYNPDKAETTPLHNGYTWHWDNLFVSSQA